MSCLICKVVQDCTGSAENNTLTLRKGETVEVVDNSLTEEWIYVQDKSKNLGYVHESSLQADIISAGIHDKEYYFPNTTSQEAAHILHKAKKGTYLVICASASSGIFNICVWSKQGYQEVPIYKKAEGWSIKGDSVLRKTIHELIEHYHVYELKRTWGKLQHIAASPSTKTDPIKKPKKSKSSKNPPRLQLSDDEKSQLIFDIEHRMDDLLSEKFDAKRNEIVGYLSKIRKKIVENKPLDATEELLLQQQLKPGRRSSMVDTEPVQQTNAKKATRTPSRAAPAPPPRNGDESSHTSQQPIHQQSRVAPPAPEPISSVSTSRMDSNTSSNSVQYDITELPDIDNEESSTDPPPQPNSSSSTNPFKSDTTSSTPTYQNAPIVSTSEPQNDDVEAQDEKNCFESIPELAVKHLTQHVRDNVRLSYNQASGACEVAFALLAQYLEQSQQESLASELVKVLKCIEIDEGSSDEHELIEAFETIFQITEDSEQRSFHLHDDENIIQAQLSALQNLIMDVKQDLVMTVVKNWTPVGRTGSYEIIDILARYFQMETRQSIRKHIVKLLLSFGTRDAETYSVLTDTSLPVELAKTALDSVPSLASLKLLTYILGCGQQLRSDHYAFFNLELVSALLNAVEDESIIIEAQWHQAAAVIIALNKHFHDPNQNIVMEALKTPRRRFATHLINLLNRQEDPSRNQNASSTNKMDDKNGVIKLLLDVYQHRSVGGEFLYTNDLLVLVEILQRELQDRDVSTQICLDMLQLLEKILLSSTYLEDFSRSHKIREFLTEFIEFDTYHPNEIQRQVADIAQRLVEEIGDDL